MLGKFIKSFCKIVEIQVTPERFYFREGARQVAFATCLYITPDKPHRVLAVGDDIIPQAQSLRVDLFAQDVPAMPPNMREECLISFLCHGKNMLRIKSILRKRVIFRNTSSLAEALGGRQRAVLEAAAMKSGALECEFPDEP